MGGSKISAGEAYVSIVCDNKALFEGLQDVSRKISQTASAVSSASSGLSPRIEVVGVEKLRDDMASVRKEIEKTSISGEKLSDRLVVTTGDVYNFLRSSVSGLNSLIGGVGDQYDKMSLRLGMSTSALSEYAHAANMCGASIANIEGASKTLSSNLEQARNGAVEFKRAFDGAGLSIEGLSAATPEEQFERVAEALGSVEDPSRRVALATKLLGSDGEKLLPMFNAGAAGLKDLRAEARALGATIDEDMAKAGADWIDATTRLNTATRGLGLTVAQTITPVLTPYTNGLARTIQNIISLSREHSKLTGAVLGSVAAISTASAAVFLMKKGSSALASAVKVCVSVCDSWRKTVQTCAAAAANASKFIGIMKTNGLFSAPSIAGWVSLGAAIAAVVLALKQYHDYNTKPTSYGAQNSYDEGNDARQNDRSSFARLQELREKQSLTNDEIQEAVRLAAELAGKYGDVGIAVDAVAGKIKIASDAQAKMNAKMVAAQKKELEAALKEARANAEGDNIAKELAREEVGIAELTIGKGRGQSWSSYAMDWGELLNPAMYAVNAFQGKTRNKIYANDDEARLALLKDDANFQEKVDAARATNDAKIASLQAQLDAIDAMESAPTRQSSGATFDDARFQQGNDAVAEFILDAQKKEQSALDSRIAAIEEKRDRLIDALRKLADPSGEVDWNDPAQYAALLANDPTARALDERAVAVNEAANAQIEAERQKDAEEQRAKAQEAVDRLTVVPVYI